MPILAWTKATHPIAEPCDAYKAMAERWVLIHDLRGGTIAMREAKDRWLPQEQKEKNENYELRLGRSVLYEAYSDAVDDLLSKPFSEPVKVVGELPDPLDAIEEDVDFEGTGLTEFAKGWMEDAIDHGASYALVEYPATGGELSAGAEQQSNIRPYFVRISASDLIGWTHEKAPNGSKRLTSIRWQECAAEQSEYGETEVKQIRRMTFVYGNQRKDGGEPAPGTVEVWREQDGPNGKQWVQVSNVPHTFVGCPLVAMHYRKTGLMRCRPVLEKLAWINLAHWQSDSDQRNNLRFARIGLISITGLSQEEAKEDLSIGPTSFVKLTNPDSKVAYVTGGTEGVTAGRQDLVDLEARMEVLGLAPMLQRRPGSQPATTAALEADDSSCDLEAWARLEEHAIKQLYEIAAQWAKVELPEDFAVDINTEFEIPFAQTADLDVLSRMEMAGQLSKQTLLEEVQRRRALSPKLDIDEELRRLAEQGPALGEMQDGGDEVTPGNDAAASPPSTPPPPAQAAA